MKRQITSVREDYKEKIEELGFTFSDEYWDEKAYYEITSKEVDLIEKASKECYDMACATMDKMVKEYKQGNKNVFGLFGFPDDVIEAIVNSWENDDLSLYGRFDFCMKNGKIKLYEFNADTPTSLLESSLIQWYWKEEKFPDNDQYNSIHENLVQSWRDIADFYKIKSVGIASVQDSDEDLSTSGYIAGCAVQAGLDVQQFDILDLRFDEFGNAYNPDDTKIESLFKLYPSEWLIQENPQMFNKLCLQRMIEPAWKVIMSSKLFMCYMSKYNNSEYILDAFASSRKNIKDMNNICTKPYFGREGANIRLYGNNNNIIQETNGDYGDQLCIVQELFTLPDFGGYYPVIGSWIIGGVPSGIGIRESKTLVTDNMSMFVPHIIKD